MHFCPFRGLFVICGTVFNLFLLLGPLFTDTALYFLVTFCGPWAFQVAHGHPDVHGQQK